MYDRIKKLCELKKISVTSLCEEFTGNSANLATWKKNNFKIQTAIRLATYFDVTLDYLILGQESAAKIPQILSEIDNEMINVYKCLDFKSKTAVLSFTYELESKPKQDK